MNVVMSHSGFVHLNLTQIISLYEGIFMYFYFENKTLKPIEGKLGE